MLLALLDSWIESITQWKGTTCLHDRRLDPDTPHMGNGERGHYRLLCIRRELSHQERRSHRVPGHERIQHGND